jgi:hypothetical protein
MNWQPISTRPINGSYLVANAKGQVAPLINGVIHNSHSSPAWDWHYGEAVTHWMPLPPPPIEKDKP